MTGRPARTMLVPMTPCHHAQLAALVGGPVAEETLQLLETASQGDHDVAQALVAAGLALGELARHGDWWRWAPATSPAARLRDLIEARADALAEAQLSALETLTRPLAEPVTAIRRIRLERAPGVLLTPREQDILGLLCEGLTAVAMARRLGLSPRTVTKHQQRLYRKLGTSDRLATVLRAQRLGMATMP